MTSASPAWVEQSIATMKPEDVTRFRGRLDWFLPLARRFVSRWTHVDSKFVDHTAEMDVLVQQLDELCDALELTVARLDHFDKRQHELEVLTNHGLAARSTLVRWWRFAFGRIALPGSRAHDRYRARNAKAVALDLRELSVAIPQSAHVAGKPMTPDLEAALANATQAAEAIDRYRQEAHAAEIEQRHLRSRRNRVAMLFHQTLLTTARGAAFVLSAQPERAEHYVLEPPPRQSRTSDAKDLLLVEASEGEAAARSVP